MVIQLFSDIVPRAGGTFVCEDGIKDMVQWLYKHPEGTNMREGERSAYEALNDCKVFTEVGGAGRWTPGGDKSDSTASMQFTGKAGDVILCHPFIVRKHNGAFPIHLM